jgi:Ni,Fe-hydrogenase I cytochrome b subunit
MYAWKAGTLWGRLAGRASRTFSRWWERTRARAFWLAFLFGGFHVTRLWHFTAMCGFLTFIPGHLIMVVLHGWANFYSMLSGWKREPEYQE